jgi:predicted amidohydrolase YtcJ
VRTLYRARRVHTLGIAPPGEWVLVDGRHVQRVGAGEPPSADRVVELPGATILPGFVDAHVHLSATGLALEAEEVRAAPSREALLAIARARAEGPGEGLVCLEGWDESAWPDPRPPAIDELDALTPRPLVLFRADGHVALVNRAALASVDLAGAEGVEHDAHGRPTGRVVGAAQRLLRRASSSNRSREQVEGLQLRAAATAAARGITAVHEMSMPESDGLRDLEVLLAHRDRLPVDATPIVATTDLPLAIALGLSAIGGDLPVDGSIGARTAAVSVPYEDGGGTGAMYLDGDALVSFLHAGHAAGLQVGVHAIGDRAIEAVLVAWERVYGALDSRARRHFRARRHRIEHVEMASDDQIERAAMLGLAASIQPAFDRLWGGPGGLYERALGPERAARMNPVRTFLSRGVLVGAGSDAPVTPLDPWLGVASLETHHDPAQRLSRLEAVGLLTVGAARLGHQEDKKGVLQPGGHADLVAWPVDPLEAPEVEGLRPLLTVSLGREVFAA